MKRGINEKSIKNKLGQIWIETVIYTLIAMVLIGLVLSFAKPKIEEFRDRSSIERTINIIKEIDNSIEEIRKEGFGNKRVIEFSLVDGEIQINGVNDSIIFEIDSRYEYSEPGKTFSKNGMNITTENFGKYKKVKIIKPYSYNITYNGGDLSKIFSKASTPYKISLTNKGFTEDKLVIDISLI